MKFPLHKTGNILFYAAILLANTATAKAHDNESIKFEKGYNWVQIKARAKKENKYIFVDGFTTWCVPCKVMAKEIFTQPAVADFFNKNFINVSVQLNVTNRDKKEIKTWYRDAAALKKTYQINVFPTFLYFNPNGELVNKIIGASATADEFISKSKLALDPRSQYNTLKLKYDAGNRDPQLLLSLINAAQTSNDQQGCIKFINEYLADQKDLLTEQNLKFIASATNKSTSPGFDVVLKNPEKIDQLAGKGKSADIVTSVLFDEIVLPLLRTNGTKTDYGGGMVVYSGDVIVNVDWQKIKESLDAKYPDFSDQTVIAAKATYYQWQSDWPKFSEVVTTYISKFGSRLSPDKINGYAWTILAGCDDKQCIESAITWSEKTISDKTSAKPYYFYTYSDLLYKSGKKEQSLQFLKDVISSTGGTNKDLLYLQGKINNNEKAW